MKVIAGPCLLESRAVLLEAAQKLVPVREKVGRSNFWLKASLRKENRTRASNAQGMGFEKAAAILMEIGEKFDMQITTDVHEAWQATFLGAQGVDMLQIPAFLARQQPLLKAAAESGKPVNIKKPQFIHMDEVFGIVDMIDEYGASHTMVTDRGTGVGASLSMDPRNMLCFFGHADKIVDITHPNKGRPVRIAFAAECLALSYIVAGADGIFLETHPHPEHALCDRDTQLSSENAVEIVTTAYNLYTSMRAEDE